MRKKLPTGTKVSFNICQGMDIGEAVIIDNDVEEDCLYYQLKVVKGSNADTHRDEKGELWVNDWEMKPIPKFTRGKKKQF